MTTTTKRPSHVLLVEVMPMGNCDLVWKEGTALVRLAAGAADPSNLTPCSKDAGNTDPLDAMTVGSELIRTGHYNGPTVSRVWNVTDQLGIRRPRIWAPELVDGYENHVTSFTVAARGLEKELLSSTVAARILFDELDEVLRVVEPTTDQLWTYGHSLRHLLIVACTEVESAWRSIASRNLAEPPAHKMKTKHYVKLAAPMKLREWSVRLPRATAPLDFTPFAEWSVDEPTQSLEWYDAYNATKHGREDHLGQAKLRHVLSALAALHVMIAAQFGTAALESLRSPFLTLPIPKWQPDDMYIRNPFNDAPEWHDVML